MPAPIRITTILSLTCSMPVSASEFIVYGNVETYSGPCIFNPCYPWYYVIDRPASLGEGAGDPGPADASSRNYIRSASRFASRRFRCPIRHQISNPLSSPALPPAWRVGLSSARATLVWNLTARKSTLAASESHDADALEKAAVGQLQGTVHAVTANPALPGAGAAQLDKSELLAVASLADKYKQIFFCDTDPAPGLLLRFQEYDRTDAEKAGGAYTGTWVA